MSERTTEPPNRNRSLSELCLSVCTSFVEGIFTVGTFLVCAELAFAWFGVEERCVMGFEPDQALGVFVCLLDMYQHGVFATFST